MCEVYPRGGGGTEIHSNLAAALHWKGSIPAGAGEPPLPVVCQPCLRSIPAGAGEPNRKRGRVTLETVYPRGGGGTVCRNSYNQVDVGLSPRGRGNQLARTAGTYAVRSIPAGAGEPYKKKEMRTPLTVYPRGGGGTKLLLGNAPGIRGLSPRGRGNRYDLSKGHLVHRSIPAGAGEPIRGRFTRVSSVVYLGPTSASDSGVYPRGGGGTGFGPGGDDGV